MRVMRPSAKHAMPLLALILPVPAGISGAEPAQEPTYDPVVVKYVKGLISGPGQNTVEKTIGGIRVSVATDVSQAGDSKYVVKTAFHEDGRLPSSETFEVTVHDDGTYGLYNGNLGIDEAFTDVPGGAAGEGHASSGFTGARITLHDREYGTPNTLVLRDSYVGCSGNNQASFGATVRPLAVDVSWDGDL